MAKKPVKKPVKPLKFRFPAMDERPVVIRLLKKIQKAMPEIETLCLRCDEHWGAEDLFYRFYHHSFKVFGFQDLTHAIVKQLRDLSPSAGKRLDPMFESIMNAGTGKEFNTKTNSNWIDETRPMVEAYFHARYFLEMIRDYGRRFGKMSPSMLPSGWAAVLTLYHLR